MCVSVCVCVSVCLCVFVCSYVYIYIYICTHNTIGTDIAYSSSEQLRLKILVSINCRFLKLGKGRPAKLWCKHHVGAAIFRIRFGVYYTIKTMAFGSLGAFMFWKVLSLFPKP